MGGGADSQYRWCRKGLGLTNRSKPGYKTLVDLEKDLYRREQAQNHMSAIARNYIGSSFGDRGKRWYQENRRRAIDKKANAS